MKNSEILKGIIGDNLYNVFAYVPLKKMASDILEHKILLEELQNSEVKYALHIKNEVIKGLRTAKQFKNNTLIIAINALENLCAELVTTQEIHDTYAEHVIDLLNFIMTWDQNNE